MYEDMLALLISSEWHYILIKINNQYFVALGHTLRHGCSIRELASQNRHERVADFKLLEHCAKARHG
jgi:hypothetical protein